MNNSIANLRSKTITNFSDETGLSRLLCASGSLWRYFEFLSSLAYK